MANEPKIQEPDIPAKQPDIQPEPKPQEIPPDKDVPEKDPCRPGDFRSFSRRRENKKEPLTERLNF